MIVLVTEFNLGDYKSYVRATKSHVIIIGDTESYIGIRIRPIRYFLVLHSIFNKDIIADALKIKSISYVDLATPT